MKNKLATRGWVERTLGVSGTRVNQLVDAGLLHTERTVDGSLRLFAAAEVEALRRQREAARCSRGRTTV